MSALAPPLSSISASAISTAVETAVRWSVSRSSRSVVFDRNAPTMLSSPGSRRSFLSRFKTSTRPPASAWSAAANAEAAASGSVRPERLITVTYGLPMSSARAAT